MKTTRICCLLLLAILPQAVIAADAAGPVAGDQVTASLTPFGDPVSGRIWHTTLASPDGQRLACLVERDSQQYVVLDGQTMGPYSIAEGRLLAFSPDSRHLVFCIRQGWMQHLVVDGTIGPGFDEIESYRVDYSAKNGTFACPALKDDRWGWLVQGPEGAKFLVAKASDEPVRSNVRGVGHNHGERLYYYHNMSSGHWDPAVFSCLVNPDQLYLSADHQHLFYFVDRRVKTTRGTETWKIPVIDGREQPMSGRMSTFMYGGNGGHFTYVTEGPSRKSGMSTVHDVSIIMDGRVVESFEAPGSSGGARRVTLSSQGSNYARMYMVRDRSGKSRNCLRFKDGREYGPYTSVGFPTFTSETDYYFAATAPSPEAKSTHGSSRSVFVHNGKQYEPVPSNQRGIVVSPDGKRLAYVAQLPTKGSSYGKLTMVVVVDGWQSQPYETVGLPVFSPDSRHVAFHAHKRDRDLVVIDGREGPPEKGIRRILFSPDSQNLWYIAKRENKQYLIHNAKDVTPLPFGHPWSSHSGSSSGCVFTQDNRHIVLVDGGKIWIDDTRVNLPELKPKGGAGDMFLGIPRGTRTLIQTDPSEITFLAGKCYSSSDKTSQFFKVTVSPIPTSTAFDALPEPSPLTPRNVQPASHTVQPPSQNVRMTPKKPTVATGPDPKARPPERQAQPESPPVDVKPTLRQETVVALEREIRKLQQRMRREKNPIKHLMLANELREKMEELAKPKWKMATRP